MSAITIHIFASMGVVFTSAICIGFFNWLLSKRNSITGKRIKKLKPEPVRYDCTYCEKTGKVLSNETASYRDNTYICCTHCGGLGYLDEPNEEIFLQIHQRFINEFNKRRKELKEKPWLKYEGFERNLIAFNNAFQKDYNDLILKYDSKLMNINNDSSMTVRRQPNIRVISEEYLEALENAGAKPEFVKQLKQEVFAKRKIEQDV